MISMMPKIQPTAKSSPLSELAPAQAGGEAVEMDGDFASMLMNQVEAADINAEAQLPLEQILVADNTQGQQTQAQVIDPNQLIVDPMAIPAQNVNPEVAPTLFNQDLVQEVNTVVQPKQAAMPAQALPVQEGLIDEVAPTTITQAQPMTMQDLLGQKFAAPQRAPAIDFAATEVDPQLMNFQDFVAQKNAVTKKLPSQGAYGMPAKDKAMAKLMEIDPQAVKALESKNVIQPNMTSTASFEAQLGAASETPALMPQVSQNDLAAGSSTQSQKVFDLKNLDTKTNASQIIDQITDYVVQARAAKEPTVNVKVRHEDMGVLDITVQRAQHDSVHVAIGTQSADAKAFLGQHKAELLSTLANAGVNVTEFKLDSQNPAKSFQQDSTSQQQQQHAGGQGKWGAEQNQRREEQQRRQDLWNLMYEREVA